MSLGGVTSIPPQPSFSFGSGPTNPPPVPAQNNFGINLLGGQTTLQPTNVPAITPVNTGLGSGFKPIVNTNPNKFLAYQNQHLQIWIDCIKEGETTKLYTTYINKTNNMLTELTFQAAVLKHVKLTINPLSSMVLQPFSSEIVNQVFLK